MKKSFLVGFLSGGIFIFLIMTIYVIVLNKMNDGIAIQYIETPVSYENKAEACFEIFQVLPGVAALATEKESYSYSGNTVLLLGSDFYTDQVVRVKNPQRIGSYSYENNGGRSMTVPVIEVK